MKPLAPSIDQNRRHGKTLGELRRLLPYWEGGGESRMFPFGIGGLDAHLARGGLVAGAVHEVAPETDADTPAAFGFATALLGRMPKEGPLLFIASPRGLADCGQPHGHGLQALGLDPARLLLVRAQDDVGALWAMEEALRSAVPAAVAGAVARRLDLKASRRLNLAAGSSGLPLILFRPAAMAGSSAAMTRWRIGAATSIRDRFGLPARQRWRVKLERCRNGRTGEWLLEWDHVAYRFCLASPMADPALPRGAGQKRLVAGDHRS